MSIYKDVRKTGNVPPEPTVPVTTPVPTTGYVMTPAQRAQFLQFQKKGWEARKAKEAKMKFSEIGKGVALGTLGTLGTYAGYRLLRKAPGSVGRGTRKAAQFIENIFSKRKALKRKPKVSLLRKGKILRASWVRAQKKVKA